MIPRYKKIKSMPLFNFIKEQLGRILISLKKNYSVALPIQSINERINVYLPQTVAINVPIGEGQLTINNIQLCLTQNTSRTKTQNIQIKNQKNLIHPIKATLYTEFILNRQKENIFRLPLTLTLYLLPYYLSNIKSIGIKNITLKNIILTQNKKAFFKDLNDLTGILISDSIKSILDLALTSSQILLGKQWMNKANHYLSVQTISQQQKIINYYHPVIEKTIKDYCFDPKNYYLLDLSDFEEAFFAHYGKKIVIKNQKIYFLF
jgi:hypothetical protein